MSDTYARYDTDGHIATITLTHEARRNRLDYSFIEVILKHLQAAANNFRIRAVILRAEGESFCEGTDPEYLSKLQQYSVEGKHDGYRFSGAALSFNSPLQENRDCRGERQGVQRRLGAALGLRFRFRQPPSAVCHERRPVCEYPRRGHVFFDSQARRASLPRVHAQRAEL